MENKIIQLFKEIQNNSTKYHKLKNSNDKTAIKYGYFERTFYNKKFYDFDEKNKFYDECIYFLTDFIKTY